MFVDGTKNHATLFGILPKYTKNLEHKDQKIVV